MEDGTGDLRGYLREIYGDTGDGIRYQQFDRQHTRVLNVCTIATS